MLKNKWFWISLITLLLVVSACSSDNAEDADAGGNNDADNGEENDGTPEPPSVDDLDSDDPYSAYVKDGEEIFNETNDMLEDNVGNELSCQSCHADGGAGESSTMVGVAADFPQYRPREGVAFTLEDRINGCMVRSMNGEMIDEDSEEMRSLVAYMTYISEGVEIGDDRSWREENTMEEVPEPDVEQGEEEYSEQNCMSCHGEEGEGTGTNEGPALWGDDSFNDGAGMGRLTKAAGYIQNNMPKGDEGSLSDQEAADIAAYVLMHERPEWDGHDDDFPEGDGPTDIMTKDRREEIRDGEFDWTEIDNVIPEDEVEDENDNE